jgi:hypothetical protein
MQLPNAIAIKEDFLSISNGFTNDIESPNKRFHGYSQTMNGRIVDLPSQKPVLFLQFFYKRQPKFSSPA